MFTHAINHRNLHDTPVQTALRYSAILVLLVSLCLLSGCKKMEIKEKANLFKSATTGYNVALRWGLYREALSYHKNKEGENTNVVDLDVLENIRVSHIEILDRVVDTEDSSGAIILRIDYYLNDKGVIKKLHIRQPWRYEEESKTWFNEGEFPQFEL